MGRDSTLVIKVGILLVHLTLGVRHGRRGLRARIEPRFGLSSQLGVSQGVGGPLRSKRDFRLDRELLKRITVLTAILV